MTTRHNSNKIRTLLIEGFSDDELRRLCFDEFEPVFNQLARSTGKAEIVDLLLEYAKQKVQIETLLTWAKEHNAAKYQMYEPYVEITADPIPFADISVEPEETMPRVNDGLSAPANKEKSPRPLSVFLSYSIKDKRAVRQLYRRLKVEGIDPWFDEEKLLPGQEWKLVIRNAVRSSDIVIVCLSPTSVTKAGFVQEEIRFALDIADQQQEGTIFLIPLKLEKCQVPERLSRWQWVNLSEKPGYDKLLYALQRRAEEIGTFVPLALAPELPPSKISILRSWQAWLLIGGGLLLTVLILAWIGGTSQSTFSLTPMPTPMPSDTVLPVVASTPTSIPTSTSTPTSTPADTPKPSNAISLPTSTPTNTPTDTAIPTPTQTPTSIPNTPTSTTMPTPITIPAPTLTSSQVVLNVIPTITSTFSVTPIPTTLTEQFVLVKPSDGEIFFDKITFEWQWNGSVGSNQGFEVRVWRDSTIHWGAHNAVEDSQADKVQPLPNNTYRLEIGDIKSAEGVKGGSGLYQWTVALVEIYPTYKNLGSAYEATPRTFCIRECGKSSNGSGDGGAGIK